MNCSVLIRVEDPSGIGEARRAAARPAALTGMSDARASDLAIIVTELAANLIKHAGQGALIIGVTGAPAPGPAAVAVLALDRGPGIIDLRRAFEDGYSTAGSPGTGLGAVARLASTVDVFSGPGQGTAILAVLAAERPATAPPPRRADPLDFFGLAVPKAGEQVSGDAFRVVRRVETFTIAVVDGLGHGPLAAECAGRAVDVFAKRAADGHAPAELVGAIHDALRSTRGAAVAVADVNPAVGIVRFCGMGNIAGALVSGATTRRMVSHNGTAGHAAVAVKEFTYPWAPGTVLVMHTDGLQSRWDLSRYPGLTARHPGLVAGVMFRDFDRGRDDCTVVVAREGAP